MTTATRVQRLREKLQSKNLEGLLISKVENRRYLTGRLTSAGIVIVTSKQAVFATDFRYAEEARIACPDFEVVQIKGKIREWLPGLISDLGVKDVGFEAGDITVATFGEMAKALEEDRNTFHLLPTQAIVEELRSIKEEAELTVLIKAVDLADSALNHIASTIKPGMTEKEAAWEIERFLKERGSEQMPFHVIVASGPNSAFPHFTPTERQIQEGEPIVIDFGAKIDGYCSDITRTFCLGPQPSTFAKIYDLVLGAQLTALATIKAGMTGEQADKLARTVIEQGGHSEDFGHGLGHGVGLEAHEKPRLGLQSDDVLADNMVFTIEPGVYLPGWGGVRIEDVAVLEKGVARALTRAEK